MLPLGMPNHTHHEPLWLFSQIEPAKTCWDTLYVPYYHIFRSILIHQINIAKVWKDPLQSSNFSVQVYVHASLQKDLPL